MSILIVDDDEQYLNYLGTMVEAMGHQRVLTASPKTACRMIEQSHFTLIIVDLRMPEISGLEILSLARKVDPLTVGIMITAYSSVESAYGALREGAFDYLLKPASVQAVQTAIQRALEHYEIKRALIQRTQQLESLRKEFRDTVLLVDDMTHKLREPLSVIYGYASYLTEQPEQLDSHEWRKQITAICDGADCMKDLLKELVQQVWSSSSSHTENPPLA